VLLQYVSHQLADAMNRSEEEERSRPQSSVRSAFQALFNGFTNLYVKCPSFLPLMKHLSTPHKLRTELPRRGRFEKLTSAPLYLGYTVCLLASCVEDLKDYFTILLLST